MPNLKKPRGRRSLFRGKRRAPVSLTLTPAHHARIKSNLERLGLPSRADFIGLLIEKYADFVTAFPTRTKEEPRGMTGGAMTTISSHAAYEQVRRLLQSVGGDMRWLPGGGQGGGSWELTLQRKTVRIQVRDNQVNELDRLCVSRIDNPTTWDDYDTPAPLRQDAFWRLVALFP
jgi:hypothetical protein